MATGMTRVGVITQKLIPPPKTTPILIPPARSMALDVRPLFQVLLVAERRWSWMVLAQWVFAHYRDISERLTGAKLPKRRWREVCLRIPTNDIKSPRGVWLSSTPDFYFCQTLRPCISCACKYLLTNKSKGFASFLFITPFSDARVNDDACLFEMRIRNEKML